MANNLTKNEITNLALEIIIKAVLLGVILFYAFSIIKPFIVLVLWGIIIAVTLSPLITKLDKKLKSKRSLIITMFTLGLVGSLLVPTYILSDSVIDSSQQLAHDLQEGTLVIPSPSENVKEWPLVGEKIYALWNGAANDLESTLIKLKPALTEYGKVIASSLGGALAGVLQFVVSLIIAAVILANSEGSIKVYHAISRRLVGEQGIEWAELSALTIRSVVQGVIGIAMIQAVLVFLGMVAIGVPFAWVWAFMVLFIAIIQVPVLLVTGPIIAYVFSYSDPTYATIFAVYAVVVSASDGFLKPIFLGRGIDIPMLVILLGAIGGMMLFGILGLFVGAVGLALAYKLFMVWLEEENASSLV
ncbi:MAG: Putative transport protein YdiK [uncultured Sulfurimonas sp.]|nr:MAG: Putative transport protein YdiK [uncultured Sulfurimonas sp.]CAI6161853.1 MAG: Putative transport protein YdiK [uncultured Sulfurimonas sp.]